MSNRSARKQNVQKRVCALREQFEDFFDYRYLLEARALNFGKKRYSTEQVKKMLKLK